MTTPTVGRIVHAVVPRSSNDGQDHTPAIITRVHKDGRVQLHLFGGPGGTVDQAQLFDDRAAALARCDEHYADLPGHREEDGKHIPGTNPRTGDPWHRTDVASWHAIAYWPAPPPAPAPPETAEERAARERAEHGERVAAAEAALAELRASGPSE